MEIQPKDTSRGHFYVSLAKSLIRTPQHPANNTLDKESNTASYGRTRLIDTLIKWELWDELISITDSPLIGPVHAYIN